MPYDSARVPVLILPYDWMTAGSYEIHRNFTIWEGDGDGRRNWYAFPVVKCKKCNGMTHDPVHHMVRYHDCGLWGDVVVDGDGRVVVVSDYFNMEVAR